jgi:hypothetical protein
VVDRIMIEQVLLNLVKNGIESMGDIPFDRRHLTIQARVLDERMLEIAVADQGHGLPEEDVERIFAPFYTTKPDGMGIGLAICRSIIEFHQGRLWVELGAKAARSSASPYRLKKRGNEMTQTIHVVDDDEAMRDSMTWLLEGEGYKVTCFDSAESFLNAAHATICAAAWCSTCACRK